MTRGNENHSDRWTRLLRRTIWDRSLLEEVPARFRPLYTVALPIQHALFGLFGLIGTLTLVPSVVALTSIDYADLWTAMVGLTGLIALAGLIWRLEGLELYSLIALTVGFATYPISALILAAQGDADRAALAAGLWTVLVLPIFRIFDLVRTLRRRHEGMPNA